MRWLALWMTVAACAFAQQELPAGLYAMFTTSAGTFTAKLFEKDVPGTVQNFVALTQGTRAWLDPEVRKAVKRPLYNNITFHRVVYGQMIQAGDPTGKGTHNCGFTIRDEFLPGLRFDTSGKLAMANVGTPDSGGCQFFVTVGPMSVWNGKYTIFGQVVQGQDVVDKINRAPGRGDQPVNPVKLENVAIVRYGPEPKGRKK